MAKKGFDTDAFLIMHRRAGFEVSAKGVVCPFLGTQDPCAASIQRL